MCEHSRPVSFPLSLSLSLCYYLPSSMFRRPFYCLQQVMLMGNSIFGADKFKRVWNGMARQNKANHRKANGMEWSKLWELGRLLLIQICMNVRFCAHASKLHKLQFGRLLKFVLILVPFRPSARTNADNPIFCILLCLPNFSTFTSKMFHLSQRIAMCVCVCVHVRGFAFPQLMQLVRFLFSSVTVQRLMGKWGRDERR